MDALRAGLAEAGFPSAQTVGASGNAIVDVPASLTGGQVERRVEESLLRTAGLATDVFVRDRGAWDSVVSGNPFVHEAGEDPAHVLVTILKSRPDRAAWARLTSAVVGRERTAPGDAHAYLVYPDGIGRSKLTPAVIERSLGVHGTSRNWNTVLRLAELLRE